MALSAADAEAVRRFAGYPVAVAIPYQPTDVQAMSNLLDLILTGLDAPTTVVLQSMLANLALLEADIPGMRENMDTKQASVWIRNENEVAERVALYLAMRRRLCAFLGVDPGPGLYAEMAAAAGASNYVPVAFIV